MSTNCFFNLKDGKETAQVPLPFLFLFWFLFPYTSILMVLPVGEY